MCAHDGGVHREPASRCHRPHPPALGWGGACGEARRPRPASRHLLGDPPIACLTHTSAEQLPNFGNTLGTILSVNNVRFLAPIRWSGLASCAARSAPPDALRSSAGPAAPVRPRPTAQAAEELQNMLRVPSQRPPSWLASLECGCAALGMRGSLVSPVRAPQLGYPQAPNERRLGRPATAAHQPSCCGRE